MSEGLPGDHSGAAERAANSVDETSGDVPAEVKDAANAMASEANDALERAREQAVAREVGLPTPPGEPAKTDESPEVPFVDELDKTPEWIAETSQRIGREPV